MRVTPKANRADVRKRVRAKIEDIDSKLASLQAIRDSLSKLTRKCSGRSSISSCPILESLDREPARFRASVRPCFPVGVCPACWPAYAGVLSSVGLGFLLQDSYLFAVMATLLAVAVATLGYRARSRRGYGPLGLGVAAAALAVVGKFVLSSDLLLYLGLGLLVVASVWNVWPTPAASRSCASCADSQRS